MSHIGKNGPVAFRRDFNLNVVNNNQGFGRRYKGVWLGFPPGVANAVNGVPFEVGPDTYPTAFNIVWESDFFVAGFPQQYKVRLTVGILAGVNLTKRLELIHIAGGTIFVGDFPIDNDARYPTFPQATALTVVFWNTNYFDFEPRQASCNLVFKLWSDPQPH
jgi:hypothetical protein